MSHWKNAIKRSNSNEIRKEDDQTLCIKDFFERQNQDNYTIEKTDKEFFVDVEGDVHIHPEDIGGDGTLGFKLRKVAGNLVCHTSSISKNVIPDELGGSIVFELENKDDKPEEAVPAQKEETAPAQKEEAAPAQNQEPGQFGACDDCPYKMGDDGFGGMHFLSNETPKESDVRIQIESLISECVENNFDIDFQSILDKVKAERSLVKNGKDTHFLKIVPVFEKGWQHRYPENRQIKSMDIYVSNNNDDKLDLGAIEKAAYLTFLLYEDGIVLKELDDRNSAITRDFIAKMQKIYGRLPDKVEDDTNGGLRDGRFSQSTMNSYRTAIRKAIMEKIKYHKLVDKFAIEGYRGKAFKIEMGTEDIRKQLRELFAFK